MKLEHTVAILYFLTAALAIYIVHQKDSWTLGTSLVMLLLAGVAAFLISRGHSK